MLLLPVSIFLQARESREREREIACIVTIYTLFMLVLPHLHDDMGDVLLCLGGGANNFFVFATANAKILTSFGAFGLVAGGLQASNESLL
jgi:hypothetical protein